jgi:hypothetical protein
MADEPLDVDSHRGMAAQKATDIRRALAEVETYARELRERRAVVEDHLLSAPAASWPEAVAKARYVLKLYVRGPAARRQASRSRRGHPRGLCPAHRAVLRHGENRTLAGR